MGANADGQFVSETEQLRATVFLDEKARLERRLQELERERERLRIQLDFLEHVLARAGLTDAGTAGRLGPTAAITRIVGLNPGMPRSQVIEEALPIIKNKSPKSRRTLAQTILNLINRGTLREESGGLFLKNLKDRVNELFGNSAEHVSKTSGQPG